MLYVQTDNGFEATLFCLPLNGWPLPYVYPVEKLQWKVLHDDNSVNKVYVYTALR